MNKNEWKQAYGAARKALRCGNGVIAIGRNYFCIHKTEAFGRVVKPAIIRDRSPRALVADALFWSRYYRIACMKLPRLQYYVGLSTRHCIGSRECIADARRINATASAFHSLPA